MASFPVFPCTREFPVNLETLFKKGRCTMSHKQGSSIRSRMQKLALQRLKERNKDEGADVKVALSFAVGTKKDNLPFVAQVSLNDVPDGDGIDAVSQYLDAIGRAGEANIGFSHEMDGAVGKAKASTLGFLVADSARACYCDYTGRAVEDVPVESLDDEAEYGAADDAHRNEVNRLLTANGAQ